MLLWVVCTLATARAALLPTSGYNYDRPGGDGRQFGGASGQTAAYATPFGASVDSQPLGNVAYVNGRPGPYSDGLGGSGAAERNPYQFDGNGNAYSDGSAAENANIGSAALDNPYSGGGRGRPDGGNGYSASDANYDRSGAVKYDFSYEVNTRDNNLNAVQFGHRESREGDDTRGEYHVLLPDGRKQTVRYTADKDGYKPQVSYEGVPSAANNAFALAGETAAPNSGYANPNFQGSDAFGGSANTPAYANPGLQPFGLPSLGDFGSPSGIPGYSGPSTGGFRSPTGSPGYESAPGFSPGYANSNFGGSTVAPSYASTPGYYSPAFGNANAGNFGRPAGAAGYPNTPDSFVSPTGSPYSAGQLNANAPGSYSPSPGQNTFGARNPTTDGFGGLVSPAPSVNTANEEFAGYSDGGYSIPNRPRGRRSQLYKNNNDNGTFVVEIKPIETNNGVLAQVPSKKPPQNDKSRSLKKKLVKSVKIESNEKY